MACSACTPAHRWRRTWSRWTSIPMRRTRQPPPQRLGSEWQPRGQFHRAEGHRRVDAQAAGRPRVVLADGAVGGVERIEDLAAGVVILIAGGGEGEAARGAVQQLRAELFFQLADLARDNGVRD